MKLSAVIIAKNEEEKIVDCLKSVQFCDEIILIDSGSTDKTNELAKKHNAKIVSFVSKNFSALRNKGLEHAQGEWVLYIDADESVPESLQGEI